MDATTGIDLNHRIAGLEHDVRELRLALANQPHQSEDRIDDRAEHLPEIVRQLITITNELVPGKIFIENSVDPEYPGTAHIIFRVLPEQVPVDVDAVIDTEIEWHRRARAVFPEATCHFRLAIER